MTTLWIIVRRLLVLSLVLLLVLLVGVSLFMRTERFRTLLRDQVVTLLNDTLNGDVTLGRVEGSIWNTLTLHDLVVTYEHTEVLRIPRLIARYHLRTLLRGHIQIAQVEAISPIVRLIQNEQRHWTLLETVSAKTTEAPANSTANSPDIVLESVAVTDATIEVIPAGQKPRQYRLTETNLLTRIALLAAGTEVQVQQLTTQLHADPLPLVRVGAVLTYQDVTAPTTVQVTNLTLDTPHSHLRVAGSINNLETLDSTLNLTLGKLATTEMKQVVPTWPLTQDLSGTLQCQGMLSDLHTHVALVAAEAQVTGDIRSNLTRDPFTYDGTLTIKSFAVEKLLERRDVAGVIDGTVEAHGTGTALQTIDSTAALTIRSLVVSRWQLGTVTVSGSMARQQGTISGTLASTFGQATWRGTVDLTAPRPRYDLSFDMAHLDLRKTPAKMEPIATDLTLSAVVSGQGIAFPEIEAQADVSVRPSTVGQVAVDRGKLAARLSKDRVDIAEFTLQAEDTTAAVRGTLGITKAVSGQLTYALTSGNITPWLALVDQAGSGALRLNGTAAGTVNALTLQGELQAQHLQLATTAVQDGKLTYQLDNVGQPQPAGTIIANLQHIEGGVPLKKIDAAITLPKGHQPTAPLTAHVALQVQDAAARTHHLHGTGSYQAPRLTVRLTELAIATPDGRWTLVQPTHIVQEQHRISIDRLLMTNGPQQLQLSGHGGLSGAQDLQLHIAHLPVASLLALHPDPPDIAGLLTIDAQVRGTATAPQLTSTLDVADLRIAGQEYAGLFATLGYDSQRAASNLTFNQDATHALTATGTLPLTLSWADKWKMDVHGDLALHARSTGLSLAFLNAFTDRTATDVAGELGLDLTVAGSVAKPRPQGSFTLTNGQVTLPALGVEVDRVTIEGQVDPEAVRITQLSARSGKGRLTGRGTLAVQDYVPQQITLSLSAKRWPVIHTRQYHVDLDGEIEGHGPLSQPQVTGTLRVPEAILRPDLAFLTAQPVNRDPTIIVLPADRPTTVIAATATTIPATAPQPPAQLAENLVLDMTIRLPRNTWIKHQDADIELLGEVDVTKRAGGRPALVGTIAVVRGWINLQGRRFTLTQGHVTFTGGTDINPSLDLTAQYKLPQYVVEAAVGGTLAKPTLTLRSDPLVEQADILALLLFGKPVSQLGQGEKTNFQQQALQMTGGYIAAQIADSVSRALGLEDLGLDVRQVDLTGGRIGFGRYLGPKTYISAAQDISGKTGHQVTVDYYLSPRWTITTSSSTGGDNAAGITWELLY